MAKNYRWGVLGLGSIANRFMSGMTLVGRAQLYAVASRSMDKARAFQAKYQAEKALDSYEALVADPQVDIVYEMCIRDRNMAPRRRWCCPG